MTIKLIRNTGITSSGAKMMVRVNGRKHAKIAHNNELDLSIPDGQSAINVSQFGIRSNTVKVKNGDVVEINSHKWIHTGLLVMIISMLMSSFIINLTYRTLFNIIALTGFLSTSFLLEGYQLKIIATNYAFSD